MELPVRKLTDILSLRVFKENGKRPFQSHVCPEMLEGSLTKLIRWKSSTNSKSLMMYHLNQSQPILHCLKPVEEVSWDSTSWDSPPWQQACWPWRRRNSESDVLKAHHVNKMKAGEILFWNALAFIFCSLLDCQMLFTIWPICCIISSVRAQYIVGGERSAWGWNR